MNKQNLSCISSIKLYMNKKVAVEKKCFKQFISESRFKTINFI